MKVLVTGFDPFGGESVNPAYEAVKKLPDTIGGAQVIKAEIPTEFVRGRQVLAQLVDRENPQLILCVGQAGGRACVTLEQTAVNLMEARIPDNAGYQPCGQAIEEKGETAYLTSLPIHTMTQKVREAGIPCHISYTAGTYVCNCLMYQALFLAQQNGNSFRAGFAHVPYAVGQVVDKGPDMPSMSLEVITESLRIAIEAAVETKEDTRKAGTSGLES